MPREPWQRIPGDALETLLREQCEKNPLITARYGLTVVGIVEEGDSVHVRVKTACNSNMRMLARYVVGCDGANSVVRTTLGISLDGGPL